MPFRSKAQIAKFGQMVKEGKISQETFDTWMSETPKASKLPEKAPAPRGKNKSVTTAQSWTKPRRK